jgi:hypothetical protein
MTSDTPYILTPKLDEARENNPVHYRKKSFMMSNNLFAICIFSQNTAI